MLRFLSGVVYILLNSQFLDELLSDDFVDELRSQIETYKTFQDPHHYYAKVFALPNEAGTAHLSIIGPDNDAVSLTTSINSP